MHWKIYLKAWKLPAIWTPQALLLVWQLISVSCPGSSPVSWGLCAWGVTNKKRKENWGLQAGRALKQSKAGVCENHKSEGENTSLPAPPPWGLYDWGWAGRHESHAHGKGSASPQVSTDSSWRQPAWEQWGEAGNAGGTTCWEPFC